MAQHQNPVKTTRETIDTNISKVQL